MNLKPARLTFASILLASILGPQICSAASLTSLQVTNIFEDTVITSGVPSLFAQSDEVDIDNAGGATEIKDFGGFYDVDVTDNRITFTLVDNSGATDPVIPAGRFDRNYFAFDKEIRAASINDALTDPEWASSVEILSPGTELTPADFFGTGIATPIVFEHGGILLTNGPGSDYTATGIQLIIDAQPVPVPAAIVLFVSALGGLVARKRLLHS